MGSRGLQLLRFACAVAPVPVLAAVYACGTGVDSKLTASTAVSPGLAYGTNPAVYTALNSIRPNLPSFTGGTAASYSVSTALPGGLALDATSGAITGTPAATTAEATYQISAVAESGTATAALSITIKPPWIGSKNVGASTKTSKGFGTATDPSGNVFVAGFTTGDLDGTLAGTNDAILVKFDSSGVRQWIRQLGVTAASTVGVGTGADSSGNVYLAGTTGGALDGGAQIGTNDFFVTRYDSAGDRKWTRQLGATAANTSMNAATVDPSGNVLLTGATAGGISGNVVAGINDVFVAKYDVSGSLQWVRQLGLATKDTFGQGVAADASGNVFAVGATNAGLDGNVFSGGTHDVFLTKYDSSGNKQWTQQLGVGAANSFGYAVATDAGGNILIGGSTTGALPGGVHLGITDAFVAKYDASGTRQWTRQVGLAATSSFARGLATDASGNIFITGYTTGGLDGNLLAGTNDLFVTKFDTSGTKQWTKQVGATASISQGIGAATDPSGNVFASGNANGAYDGITLLGAVDLLLTKFNTSGTKQ